MLCVLNVFAVAVLEFLSASARAWVVAAHCLLHAYRFALHVLACVVLCGGLLMSVIKVYLGLAVFLLLSALPAAAANIKS